MSSSPAVPKRVPQGEFGEGLPPYQTVKVVPGVNPAALVGSSISTDIVVPSIGRERSTSAWGSFTFASQTLRGSTVTRSMMKSFERPANTDPTPTREKLYRYREMGPDELGRPWIAVNHISGRFEVRCGQETQNTGSLVEVEQNGIRPGEGKRGALSIRKAGHGCDVPSGGRGLGHGMHRGGSERALGRASIGTRTAALKIAYRW